MESEVRVSGRGGNPARSARGVSRPVHLRGAAGVNPIQGVSILGSPELFVELFVDGPAEYRLDFDVAAVCELRGVDPGLLANVEAMPVLDGVDGLLDFLDDLGVEAGLRDAKVTVRGKWGWLPYPR